MPGLSLFQLLNGLTFASLLFTVASGFTLVFGLLRIVNLAHGALYLLGGYVGYSVTLASGSFALGAVAAALAAGLAGLVLQRGLLRFVGGSELRQVLLTLGVGLVLDDLALVAWGGDTFTVPKPPLLQGALRFSGLVFPRYRLMVLISGVVVFILLWLLLNRTRLGALIRAGVDDPEIIAAMGINIRLVFLLTFMLGTALAGLGGMIGGGLAHALSGGGRRDLGVLARRGDHWWPRQPGWRCDRRDPGRIAEHDRAGDVPGTRLLRHLRPDGGHPGVPSDRLVRTPGMRAARLAPIVLALLAVLPSCVPTFAVSIATQVLIFAILAMSIDVLAGFAGRTSLGHGAIFGVATYVVLWWVSVEGGSVWLPCRWQCSSRRPWRPCSARSPRGFPASTSSC